MEKNEEEAGVDKISDLPDSILHHIFSFLNMEEAVRSSVLSNRWRHLWTSLPTLNFDYKDITEDENLEGIANLVDMVFNLRDGSSNITRFSLICQYLPYTSPVGTWVTSALRCNVQELIIELDFDLIIAANFSSLFNSKSLTFLRLVCTHDCEYLELQLPDSVCLPSLKTLFLENFSFGDDSDQEYDDTIRLVSSCPVLESLTIAYSWFKGNVKISSISLKHLVLEENAYSYAGFVKLITPNLISFKCYDYTPANRYYLEDISSLIKADIYMDRSFEENEYGDDDEYMHPEDPRMLKFLRAFCNVKDLTLSGDILKVVSGDPELLGRLTSKFCNLKQLKLKIRLSSDNFHAVTYLLKISPVIESLFLEISKEEDCQEEDCQEEGLLMDSSLDHLKFVEIRGLVGCAIELSFLELLLKNAMTMEKLVVFTSKKKKKEAADEI